MTSTSTREGPSGRRRLVLLDHSLKTLGGHHLEYAVEVLKAAQQMGFEPVIVANARFRPESLDALGWRVIPAFPDTCYDFMRLEQRSAPGNGRSSVGRLIDSVRLLAMQWRFGATAGRVLRLLSPGKEDVLFFATMSDREIVALSKVCARDCMIRRTRPHVLVHFPRSEGRRTAPAELPPNGRLRGELQAAESLGIRIHATTEALAAQYRALGASQCDELAWCVRPSLVDQRTRQTRPNPVRIAFPSAPRQERGTAMLAAMMPSLRLAGIDGQRAQLIIQAAAPDHVPESMRPHASFHVDVQSALASRSPIVALRWPLAEQEYEAFIRSVDIGVLPYSPKRFYARASGVLIELLAGGTPVVVLAGSWLSRQFREEAWRHVERTIDSSASTELPLDLPETLSIDADGFELPLPDVPPDLHPHSLAITMEWESPETDEATLLLEVGDSLGFDAGSSWRDLIERRDGRCPGAATERARGRLTQGVIVPIMPGSPPRLVRLSVSEGRSVTIARMRVLLLGGAQAETRPDTHQAPPISAVGLQACDETMLPRLLSEACMHYAHYSSTAQTFARAFREAHRPAGTVARLSGGAELDPLPVGPRADPGYRDMDATRST